jgi:hypothetical protein
MKKKFRIGIILGLIIAMLLVRSRFSLLAKGIHRTLRLIRFWLSSMSGQMKILSKMFIIGEGVL